MDKRQALLLSLANIKFLRKMPILCVRVTLIKPLVTYDFAHNPVLYSHTSVGRMQATATGQFDDKASQKSEVPRASTTHWKSTYNGNVEYNLSRPLQKSQRPEWSLPRHAYTSQRALFATEN